MMNFKIKILDTGPMILTGSKILKAIMDNHTPPIDLFVREVIQNSADATLKDKDFAKIKFNIGKFKNDILCDSIKKIKDKIKSFYPDQEYDFISISDSNTCGLLGKHKKSDIGPNNLYNLVYDFMNDKDDENAGGSYGIGKSVYYRYGNGLCFYYSRTYEYGEYKSKLAGALIQDERKDNCIVGKNSSGIAYFGDIINNDPAPINDENEIEEFLNIFNLKPYSNDTTGTIVIIPYIDVLQLLESNNNSEEEVARYWLNDISQCLSMSIQRWYFPRINNDQYKGKHLLIAVNDVKVDLCVFFQKLQDLYNGTLGEANSIDVTGKGFSNNELLGTFNYKLFSKEELGVHTPPLNLPEPRFIVDSANNCDKKNLLFYTRKPGMIINYDNSEFGNYDIEDGKFLIGVFILNDELNIENEILGRYIRKTEKSNHKEWNNSKFDEFPYFSKKRPFSKISAFIRQHLNDVFKKTKAVTLDASTTILQRLFADKLLPPLDFGNKPSPADTPTLPTSTSSKKRKTSIVFDGLNEGNLQYTIDFNLKQSEWLKFRIDIKAGAKTFTFVDWEKMEFAFPCSIYRIDIIEFYINNSKKPFPQNIALDDNFGKRRKKTLDGEDIYKIKGLVTENNVPYGFKIYNAMTNQLRIKIILQIKPLDNKYSISFNTVIDKVVPYEE